MTEPKTDPEVIHMRFPSRLELLGMLDSVTLTVCERMKFDTETASQVAMAVIEGGTNAIQHGHRRDASRPVDVDYFMYPDRLQVDVHDTGPGFDLSVVNGDPSTPDHLFDSRGRGIFIMRACVDAVNFEFSGTGTVCHLIKYLPSPSSGQS